jgi:hypothetical protein
MIRLDAVGEKQRARNEQAQQSHARARYTTPCAFRVDRRNTFFAGQRTMSCRASYLKRLDGIRFVVAGWVRGWITASAATSSNAA